MKKQLMTQSKIMLFATGLLVSAAGHAAALNDWLPQPKIDTKGLKTMYAGVGMTNELVHLNAEFPTGYGSTYVKVGSFLNGADEVAGQIGFRYPYLLTGTDKNGYYFGGFIGHIESKKQDGDEYNRLGFGGELSYVWLNSSRMSAASIALAAGERKKDNSGNREHSTPLVLFSYSFNFGIY